MFLWNQQIPTIYDSRHPKSSPPEGSVLWDPQKMAQNTCTTGLSHHQPSSTPQVFQPKNHPNKKNSTCFLWNKKNASNHQLSPISIRIKSTGRWWQLKISFWQFSPRNFGDDLTPHFDVHIFQLWVVWFNHPTRNPCQVVSDGFSPGFFDGLTSEAWQLLRLAADHPAASCLGTLGRGRTMGWLDWSTEDHQRATHGDEVKIVVIFPETDIGTPQK